MHSLKLSPYINSIRYMNLGFSRTQFIVLLVSKNRFEGDDFDINSLLYSSDIATHVVALRTTLYKNITSAMEKGLCPQPTT